MAQAKHVTRLRNLGLQGPFAKKDWATESRNTADGYYVTLEIPITRVASTTAQTTEVTPALNAKIVQCVQAILVTTTAEVTGTTKTISIGIGAAGNNIMNAASCAALGGSGQHVSAAVNVTPSTNKLTYTLGANNFAEFTGYAIITLFVIE